MVKKESLLPIFKLLPNELPVRLPSKEETQQGAFQFELKIHPKNLLKNFSIPFPFLTGGYSGKTTAGISGVFIFFTGIGYDRSI